MKSFKHLTIFEKRFFTVAAQTSMPRYGMFLVSPISLRCNRFYGRNKIHVRLIRNVTALTPLQPITSCCSFLSMKFQFHCTNNVKSGVILNTLSRVVRKPDFCLCGNKGADQLRSNCEADQRLCFRYTDSTVSLLLESEISSF